MKSDSVRATEAKQRTVAKRRRVLLVDDHPIVRHGLAQLINQEDDLEVCAEAATASEAQSAVESSRPDVMVLDISLDGANGLEVAKNIHHFRESLPILILSMHDEALYAERALKAGAKGYVMKQEPPEKVLSAIRKVLSGECYLSEKMTSQLLSTLIDGGHREPGRSGVESLSDRELEIFELVGHGLSTRKIARKLNLSVKTVETHYTHIKEKLQIADATELMHRAVHWVHVGSVGGKR